MIFSSYTPTIFAIVQYRNKRQIMKSVLFVCLGNICRSPLAHGVAQNIAQEKKLELSIDSAGTSNWHAGEAPCDNSIRVAKQYNIDISRQYSRIITQDDISSFHYVIAMDSQNREDMKAFGFKNIYLLGDFGGYNGADVPDPYFFDGFEGFEKVYTMISVCIEDFIAKVEDETL